MHESSMYRENVFLTLTYRDEELPIDETLDKEHHKNFMKRLRKKHGFRKIRFYHCGEYGETTHRPHYHTIIFNLDFLDKRYLKTTETGSKLYTSADLDRIWSHGDCYIGSVTFESAAYCGRYVMKKLTGARKSEYGSRIPEYSTQSRKPGIGKPWLDKWQADCFPNDFCIMNGKKIRVPKYYDQLMIGTETPAGTWVTDSTGFPIFMPSLGKSAMEKIKGKRLRNAAKHSENQTRDRLDVIEELTQLRVDRLSRKL